MDDEDVDTETEAETVIIKTVDLLIIIWLSKKKQVRKQTD